MATNDKGINYGNLSTFKTESDKVYIANDKAQNLSDAAKVQAQNNMIGKAYNAEEFSGLGKKVLAKNIIEVSGVNKNVMMQSFFNAANTVYVIQYDYTLGENITIPDGCTLEFDGGSISGNYTLEGQDTIIQGNGQIFSTTVTFSGGFSVENVKSEWFGCKESNNDNAAAINAAVVFCKNTSSRIIKFNAGRFNIKSPVLLASSTVVDRDSWGISIEGAGAGCAYTGTKLGTQFDIYANGYFFVNQYNASTSGWQRNGFITRCAFFGRETGARGIIINQSSPYSISMCYFGGLTAAVIITDSGYNVNTRDCVFRSNTYGVKTLVPGEEFYGDGGGANNNSVVNCRFSYNENPIYLPEGEGWSIRDCDIESGNGTIYVTNLCHIDNVRIESNDVSKAWLRIGSRCTLTNVMLYSAGTTANAFRVLIEGDYNIIESISFNGFFPLGLLDTGHYNKYNISTERLSPQTQSFMFNATAKLNMNGISNYAETEQGLNIISGLTKAGGSLGVEATPFVGYSVNKMSAYNEVATTEAHEWEVIYVHLDKDKIFGIDFIGEMFTPSVSGNYICVVSHDFSGNASTIYRAKGIGVFFASSSKDIPCFNGLGSSQTAIKSFPDHTEVYLTFPAFPEGFGGSQGGGRQSIFSEDVYFMFHGIRYTAYLDSTEDIIKLKPYTESE